MKGMDIFCASPASTAICSGTEHHSMVRDATRPIDHRSHRHNYLHDRQKPQPHVPCSSRLPILPRSFSEKNRKSSAKKSDLHRKSSADITDLSSSHGYSSRHLLSDSAFIDWFSDSEHVPEFVPTQSVKTSRQLSFKGHSHAIKSAAIVPSQSAKTPRQLKDRSHDAKSSALVPSHSANTSRKLSLNGHSPALKSSSSAHCREQVVVLRVSIHCKGCEGKIRKHISKMEGVTSFSIDFASKKVIIKGDVTPLGVLSSVSKVKNAQLWPSPTSSSPS